MGFKKWCSANVIVVFFCLFFFFLTLSRSMFHGKFVKSERFLAVLWEHVIFNVKWVEVCKINEIFWAKLYYKMTDLFWLWDFLLEDLKFKELWWSPLARVDKYFFFHFLSSAKPWRPTFLLTPTLPPPLVFCKKGVLREFTKFTGKNLCQSLFINKVAGQGRQLYFKKDPGTGVFCEFVKFRRTHVL